MIRKLKWIFGIIGVMGIAVIAHSFADVGDGAYSPSPVIFPDQQIPIRFNHRIHQKTLRCEDCHPKAPLSETAKELLTPAESVCLKQGCHTAEEPPDRPCRNAIPATCPRF